MLNQISGKLLFFRYAFPCVDDKLKSRQISQGDYCKCQTLVDHNTEPSISLLRSCFPKAIDSFCKFIGNDIAVNVNEELMTLERVQEFWRHNHGHTGDCAVRFGVVQDKDSISARVLCGTDSLIVFNRYNISYRTGETVSFHRRIVAEKIGG